jgi:hypothetical protein
LFVIQNLFEIRLCYFVNQANGHIWRRKNIDQLDNIGVFEFPQQFDFANGGKIDAFAISNHKFATDDIVHGASQKMPIMTSHDIT